MSELNEKNNSKSAEDIQDRIFRKMSAGEKLKMGSDFALIGLALRLQEGTEIPLSYIRQWLKWNHVKNHSSITKFLKHL